MTKIHLNRLINRIILEKVRFQGWEKPKKSLWGRWRILHLSHWGQLQLVLLCCQFGGSCLSYLAKFDHDIFKRVFLIAGKFAGIKTYCVGSCRKPADKIFG